MLFVLGILIIVTLPRVLVMLSERLYVYLYKKHPEICGSSMTPHRRSILKRHGVL